MAADSDYRPWQPIAIDLFERFKRLDYVLARIARSIEDQPYLFPYPTAQDMQRYMFKTLMRRTDGGYTFSSGDSIHKYFSNLTLGGYAKVGQDGDGNVLYLANAFEAAIPMDLLAVSYAALKGHYPDGTPYEGRRLRIRTHTSRRSIEESSAILHGILESEDGLVFYHHNTRLGKPFYGCNADSEAVGRVLKGKIGIASQRRIWSVPCEELDHIVIERLSKLAQFDCHMSERMRALWIERQSDKVNEADLLNTQIEKAEAQIRRLDKLLTDPASTLSLEAERRHIEMLRDAETERQRLTNRRGKVQASELDPTQIITDFYRVLEHLPSEFPKLSLEDQKRVARQVIKQIRLRMLSPHNFLLSVEWQQGIAACPDIALLWRGKCASRNVHWSDEEHQTLATLYPTGTQVEVMQALPSHPWCSIYEYAHRQGLHRSSTVWSSDRPNTYFRTVTYRDVEAATNLVIEPEQRARLIEVMNSLARRSVRGGVTAHWWHHLEAVSLAESSSAISEELGAASFIDSLVPVTHR